MSDPLRTETSRALEAASGAERDAKIEQLLLAGLDHYFAAHYEQAINVWTRALFFDRSHARARAYIERARSALAERQREAEELLQGGAAAFRRGDTGEARRLLQAAIDGGAAIEDAFPMLERLQRLDPVPAASPARSHGDRRQPMAPALGRTPWRVGLAASIIVLLAIVAVGTYAAVSSDGDWRSWLILPAARSASTMAPVARDVVLAIPRRGESALTRARSLAAGGDLHNALSVLDRVRTTDPQKSDADALRADIQRQLLSLTEEGLR